MIRLLTVLAISVSITSANARPYGYFCNDNGKWHSIIIDKDQWALTWGGNTYWLSQQTKCPKRGLHAEGAGLSFDICNDAKGYLNFELNGARIQCDLRKPAYPYPTFEIVR
jgi:hypothetical protein